MIRRILLVAALAVVVLAVVGDRLAQQAAQRALSIDVRQQALLATNPVVHIDGFPFLTQAARGRYQRIDITTHGIHRGGLRLDTVTATFTGVHVGLSALLGGTVHTVPIDSAQGSVGVTYTDLDVFLAPRQLRVGAVGGALRLSGTAVVGGHREPVAAGVDVAVTPTGLAFTPLPGSIRVAGAIPPAAVATALSASLATTVSIGELPFGLTLRSVAVGLLALTVSASATGLTVAVPADAAQR